MGWGAMTQRQYVLWLAWRNWRDIPPEQRNRPKPPPQFILTKEKIAEMRKQRALHDIRAIPSVDRGRPNFGAYTPRPKP